MPHATVTEDSAPLASPSGGPKTQFDDRRTPELADCSGDLEHDDDSDNETILEDYPDNVVEIDLTHCRIRTPEKLRLVRFYALERLGLRQNLIRQLCSLPPSIQELDLYDNRIESVPEDGINELKDLTSLDLSFNRIKDAPAGLDLPKLRDLYFASNRISTVPCFKNLPSITNLELGANKIRTIANLSHLTTLRELWLGKNKISEIQGVENLVNLRILSLQSNRIRKISGLDTLTNLEELYLAHNGLTRIAGLEKNLSLRILEVASNEIEHLENVSHLALLEELWANDNKLSSFEEIENQLGKLRKLETVYFERNPLQKAQDSNYRRKLLLSLPTVKQIDATMARS